MKKICVYCSSSRNLDPAFVTEIQKIGHLLVENQFHTVYGGANMGCMGALADSVVEKKGDITGIVPKIFLEKDFAHKQLTHTHFEEDMYDRKKKMFEISDAFLIFPGGLGTMDEALEALCYNQIGSLNKPVIFYNFRNFWSPLISYLRDVKSQNIINGDLESLFEMYDSLDEVFQALKKI